MLLLGSKTFTVGGVTVFSDHADPNQFWYLPAPVELETRDDGEPQFTLITYRPAVVAAGVQGGGYLMFTSALPSDTTREEEIKGQIATYFPDITDPRLTPAPFDEGTVQCVALDVQGPGGTPAPAAHDGAFEAAERILGASAPSLMGNNDALFSLTLSQKDAIILAQAFDNQLQPVGVIYQLKYTGVRPALDVKITADLKRAYEAFSVGLSAQAYYVSVGIDATFEKLVQDGTIKVEVTNLAPNDAENKDKEQWALQLFKDNLLADWFRPSLSPTSAQAADGGVPTVPSNPSHPSSVSPSTTPGAPAGTPAAASPGAVSVSIPTPGGTVAVSPSGGSVTAPGAKGVKPVPQGVNPANTAAGGAPFGAALRLRAVVQEELKTVTVQYNRQDAVQRTYGPQGYFGVLLSSINRSKHQLDVDLDAPFFRNLSITGTPPGDFDAIGLSSVHVAIDYGSPDDPAAHKHGEMMFDSQHKTAQTWEVYKNPADTREYQYAVDWHFNPASAWIGEKATYSSSAIKTENSDLNLNPFEFLTFGEVRISPGRIDWNLIDYIEIDLDYTGPSGWHTAGHFEFHSDTKAQSWKLRLEGRAVLSYSWRRTHYLKDGTTIPEAPVTSQVPAVVVTDPFFYLDVQIQPLFDATKTKLAYVDVRYEDTAAAYAHEENLTFSSTSTAPVKLRLPVLDLDKKSWTYRLTLVGTGNQITRNPWTETSEDVVFITDTGVQ